MAARQLARLRQQQERLAEPSPEAEESDSSGDDAVAAPRNAFDLLMAEDGDTPASEEDDEEEPAAAAAPVSPAAGDGAAEGSATKKKAKKKARAVRSALPLARYPNTWAAFCSALPRGRARLLRMSWTRSTAR